jgi:beta-lactamase regulating signal transducer with metallopeptidase domain
MIATNDFMYTLAWSLLHFLWQGAAIAAVAAACMFVFHKPATRYVVGIGALALMLASFAITFALIGGPSGSTVHVGAPAAPVALPLQSPAESVRHFMEPRDASTPALDFLWIARGWLVGVCAFALRIAFGLLLIEYLRRRNLVALPDALVDRFRALQQRLGIRRAIRYCECQMLRVPAVIGIFRPIVLLPMRALTGLSQEQLEAVIAHELGHIKRLDVAVNFFQVIAETLFFFHPAVWWLNRRIRADREDCCDDVAVSVSGGLGYARALATMESWRNVPSFAMAATGSPVAARIARLIGVTQRDTGSRAAGVVTASLVLATALVAGAFSIGVANPALAQAEQAAPVVSPEPVVEAEVSPAPSPVPVPVAKPAPAPKPAKAPKPPREPKPASESAPVKTASGSSYIEEMKSVGFDQLDVDELIGMKIHGITAAYVRDMRSTGMNPDVNVLIAMKSQGITPEYVKEIRALGFAPDENEFVAMKIHGVTPDYVKGMRDLGVNPDADEFIALKVHDVTPEYRQALEKAGYKLSVSETIAAKIMDITPEFIEKVRASGFKNMNVDKLIQLKNADIL